MQKGSEDRVPLFWLSLLSFDVHFLSFKKTLLAAAELHGTEMERLQTRAKKESLSPIDRGINKLLEKTKWNKKCSTDIREKEEKETKNS